MAATVLIAAQLLSITEAHVDRPQLDVLLEQVDQVLVSCEPSTNIAHKCRVALRGLNEKVRSSLNMSAARSEGDQPQGSRVDLPTGEPFFEESGLEFGPEGIGIDALDVYPFSSNEWPVSFGNVIDDETRHGFWAPF